MFDMLCGAARLMWDRARAGWRVHESGNATQWVVRELEHGTKGQKKTSGGKNVMNTHVQFEVELALANRSQRLPSVCGSAKRNRAINYHGDDRGALQLQHLD